MEYRKKIRVMHVAQSAGGVDRYLRMLLKYINKEKFDNIVVLSDDFNEDNYKEFVIAYETVQMKREISFDDCRAIVGIRQLIKKYQPDIVYAHSSKAGAIARMANIGLKNYCIYNPHGWAFNMQCSNIKKNLYALIEKIAAIFCDKIVCISDSERESAMKKHICNKNKLQVIYNGIDIQLYEQRVAKKISRSQLEIPDDAFVVGMVGRLSQQKAPDVFIEAASRIRERLDNVFFLIVGSGEMEQYVIEYAKQHNLQKCLKITGWVEDSMDYIEIFDVACLLSRWEGFGLVLPEYMLAGKPIVATDVDAIPNIIEDRSNGLLVPVDNAMLASKAVIELHDNVKLRELMVKREKHDVKKYNVMRVAKEHMDMMIEGVKHDRIS